MNLKSLSKLLIAFFILTITSCVSMTTMQTARTNKKGEVTITGGGGSIKTQFPIGTVDTFNIALPFIEGGVRYGITDKIDAGLKFTIIGSTVLDGKYQFLGDQKSKIAGSVGLSLGYVNVSINDTKSDVVDFSTPIYFSYHPTEWLAVYTSPKYTLRSNFYTYTSTNQTATDFSNWYGLTGGLKIGEKVAFLAEYSYFKSQVIDIPFNQFTCGVSYTFK